MKKTLPFSISHTLICLVILIIGQLLVYGGPQGVGRFYAQVYYLHAGLPYITILWLVTSTLVLAVGAVIMYFYDGYDSDVPAVSVGLVFFGFIANLILFFGILFIGEVIKGFTSLPL